MDGAQLRVRAVSVMCLCCGRGSGTCCVCDVYVRWKCGTCAMHVCVCVVCFVAMLWACCFCAVSVLYRFGTCAVYVCVLCGCAHTGFLLNARGDDNVAFTHSRGSGLNCNTRPLCNTRLLTGGTIRFCNRGTLFFLQPGDVGFFSARVGIRSADPRCG